VRSPSRPLLRIALVGQPNSGKSTVFNHLVGYKAHTSNLPGTTVEYLSSEAFVDGTRIEVVDLPGTYSLTSLDEAEAETRRSLLTNPPDAVLNIVDASLLSRSLELTYQVLELGIPTVLCLNMMDEARRKGISIDAEALSSQLGIRVIEATAVRGTGVKESVSAAIRAAKQVAPHPMPRYSADIEGIIQRLEKALGGLRDERLAASPRLSAIKLLEGDPWFADTARRAPGVAERVEAAAERIRALRGRTATQVIAAERHHRSMSTFEASSQVGAPLSSLRDRIDGVLMHPAFGPIALGAILYGLFLMVFKVGTLLEGPLIGGFDRLLEWLGTQLPAEGIAFAVLSGLVQGFGGGLGIVLPYLVPFLVGLALLEDVGYLPRAGYLADNLMHRIGLHGKSVIPFILGYGCSIPAVMATRILESRRDRFVTAMLSIMVPCVARTTIIYGLVGYFVGPHLAFSLYVLNLLVIGLVGKWMTAVLPSVTPGLILEIPSYKIPSPRVVVSKVWLRVREFLRYAMPILVVGSIVLELLSYWDVSSFLDLLARPITWSLGLPAVLGIPLVFGVFRKELSLVMLFQALGTTQVAAVLTAAQMYVFAVFVIFYVPCIATVAVLRREFGALRTLAIVGATTGIALVVALLLRGVWALF
jgi:ferrous iron transport protein B